MVRQRRRCLGVLEEADMVRVFFAAVVVTSVLPVTWAAPRPKDGLAGYFPTRVGAKWVYDDGKESVQEVTAVEAKGGETIVTVSEHTPKRARAAEKVAVSAAGVYRVELSGSPIDRYCLLKLPAKEGDKWEFDVPRQPGDGQRGGIRGERGTVTVGPTEEVEVPAGKFKAVRLEIELTAINGEVVPAVRYTRWMAPEVGLVKMTRGTEWTRVLKSFVPGR
jgi:hypothetical protein